MEPTKLMNPSDKAIRAFTLIELAVVLAVVAFLSAMVLPAMARARGTASRIACTDNLKQIGVAFNSWKVNHFGQYPMNVLNTAGGPSTGSSTLATLANNSSASAAQLMYTVFGTMSNELSTPKICVCPSDERGPHSNFTMSITVANGVGTGELSAVGTGTTAATDNDARYFNNFKVSYFLGVNATDAHPQMLLAGDRNVWGDNTGTTTQPTWNSGGYGNQNGTQYWIGTNWGVSATYPQWSPTKMHQSRGNVLLADGSVQQLSSSRLRLLLASSADTTPVNKYSGPNTLLFP